MVFVGSDLGIIRQRIGGNSLETVKADSIGAPLDCDVNRVGFSGRCRSVDVRAPLFDASPGIGQHWEEKRGQVCDT